MQVVGGASLGFDLCIDHVNGSRKLTTPVGVLPSPRHPSPGGWPRPAAAPGGVRPGPQGGGAGGRGQGGGGRAGGGVPQPPGGEHQQVAGGQGQCGLGVWPGRGDGGD